MIFNEKLEHAKIVLIEHIEKYGFKEGIKSGRKALNNEGGMETWIVGLAVGILVLAYVLPMAFNAFYSTSVSAFCKTSVSATGSVSIAPDTTVIALWFLIPVLIIIGIIIFFATHRHTS